MKKRLKQDIVLASTSIDASLMTSPIAPRYAQFYYPPTYLPPLSPVYVGPPTITYYSSPPVYVGPPVIVRTGPFFRSFIP